MLLKNIAGNYTEQIILDEFPGAKIPQVKIIKVKLLSLRKSIVQITADRFHKNLTQVKRLCCQKIKWERLCKPKIIQCTRCQRVDLTASTCAINYRHGTEIPRKNFYHQLILSHSKRFLLLDCCITNLNITDFISNKIETVDYDSDYRALLLSLQLSSPIQVEQFPKKFNFKTTGLITPDTV
ncbi:Protein of unknown function [Cotesia congregata]|uniref:Uncharacterized protein n=1 Tax=Cotesia congregata TaxID=51543 RepID=A0A8J2H6K7_COTCN|nr:Protein of unknown function [Cotesia congregata]